MTRLLVTGATGLLGPYISEAAADLGTVTEAGRTGGPHRADLTDAAAARRLIDAIGPDIVLNCAAMTDVDECEREPDRATAVNCRLVGNLAAALPEESRLVQFSTDQVYPDLPGPHAEGSEAPVNMYGRSKLAGEEAALAHGNALVLRVNFFGPSRTPGRSSLSDWMIESLGQGRAVTLFADSLFSPLHLATLAATAIEAIRVGLHGIFNVGSREGMSKADFGLAIARRLGLPTDSAEIGASSSAPGRAPRPRDLRMAPGRIEDALGRTMPTLDEEIALLQGKATGATT